MAALAADAAEDREAALLLAAGDPYVVAGGGGVILRSRASRDSPQVGELPRGTRVAVDAYAELRDGTVRARLDFPIAGWASAKCLRPLSLKETLAAAGDATVVLYAVNAKIGAKWYYGWLRDVLLRDHPHVFFPVGADFFGEYGRRVAENLPANTVDRVADRARLLAPDGRVLLVWNDFEHDRDVIARFVAAGARRTSEVEEGGLQRTLNSSA